MRSFQDALLIGHEAERNWVEVMRGDGLSVAHGSKLVVKHFDRNREHTDSPDAVGLFGIEVKERNLRFTCPEDYPYNTVFVDDLRGMGKEKIRNLVYVFLSRPTQEWVWLSILDQDDTWTRGETYDRYRRHNLPILIAPRRHLRPASQLQSLLIPHGILSLVDGNTELFVTGGGKTQERERYAPEASPGACEGT